MKNKIILLMLLSIITAFSYQESYEVLAHFEEIDVTYDACDPLFYNMGNDGINERWYNILPNSNLNPTYHYYNTNEISTQTIKYYISDYEYNPFEPTQDSLWNWNTELYKALNGELPWDELENDENSEIDKYDFEIDDIPSIANTVKEKFEESMKKWNNVYIYCIDNNGLLTKKRLINIIEGTSQDYNLIVAPLNSIAYKNTYPALGIPNAYIATIDSGNCVPSFIEYEHRHHNEYVIRVDVLNVYRFREDAYLRTGAHEIGHMFGLDDTEKCGATNIVHHEETLMGWGSQRQTNITYKDIAGAMITMGFHTANDHKWMYTEDSNIIDPETGNIIINDGYKLICSICNGVKYSTSIPNGSVEYLSCGSNHSLSSGHMMAVASYGTKDYYKCKYCRYVAPFELNAEQTYGYREYINGNTTQHYAHSNNGLTYKILEDHFSDYESNIYERFQPSDLQYSTKHIVNCGCNEVEIVKFHVYTDADVNDGNSTTTCIDCKAVISNSGPGIVGPLSNDIWQVTDNGSYKLTNGIIILVEEDIDAYKKGTLVFNDANSEIM